MSGQDIAFMVVPLVWVLAELLVPNLMGTRRPARRGSGRMAARPYGPYPARDPGHRW